MFRPRLLHAAYFLFSLLNLSALKESRSEPLSEFMVSRGLTAMVLSLGMVRVMQGTFRFRLTKPLLQRLMFGGSGMSMMILSASRIPITLFALLNRATPLWFTLLLGNKLNRASVMIVLALAATPLLFWRGDLNLVVGIAASVFGTLLIALSQIAQIASARIDSPWSMPFAPALGMSLIGMTLLAFSKISGSTAVFELNPMGILSGIFMTGAYWLSQPILARERKPGAFQILLCDLSASVVLGVFGMMSNIDRSQNAIFAWTPIVATLLVAGHVALNLQSRRPSSFKTFWTAGREATRPR